MTARTIASEGPAHAYHAKSHRYFANPRTDFVERLPHDATARVLEVGCGTGVTGALALARGRAGYYAGIELFPAVAEEARGVLSEIIVGDVEQIDLPWQPAFFDALILSEVLEHLVEPWVVLKRLARVVRPGGTVLASSPNVAQWRVLRELLHGRFELADQGVFDRTHMRWFTPSSYAAMFERSGFAVTEVGPVTPFSDRTRIVSRLLGGRFDHLFMTQIALEAVRR